MKFVAIFLACLVAAQATPSGCPDYQYWCSHNFLVFPAHRYYCYTLPFNRCWCTGQYYQDVLIEFPKAVGNTCEKEKEKVETCIAVYEGKLKEAREKIKADLQKNRTTFLKGIDDLHAIWQSTFESYLKRCYAVDSAEYKEKHKDYLKRLADARKLAEDDFDRAIENIIARIKAFHDQIIARFRSCLATRDSRLKCYNAQLKARTTAMVARYKARLDAIVLRRYTWVKNVFDKLYAGTAKADTWSTLMDSYKKKLEDEVEKLVNKFKAEIEKAVEKLEESYRCSNKCYFNVGCRGFSRRSYSRSCVRFPSPPKYSYKLYGMCAFNADWNGCVYRCLRTCTDAEKKCEFKHEKHIKEIEDKETEYKADLVKKVKAWKEQIDQWKKDALAALTQKITCMYPRNCYGVPPTQAEITAFQEKLKEQAKAWIEAKALELIAQVDAIEARISARISSWVASAKAFIMKVKARFDCCVTNKEAKIKSYIACLINKIDAQRKQLQARLKAMADRHKLQYDRFHECSFGTDATYDSLKTNYKKCVDTKVDAVMKKFEDFWAKWQPKLEEHYTCGFKCTTKVTTPTLRLCYNWNFCAPSTSYCRFYY